MKILTKNDIKRLALARHSADKLISTIPPEHQEVVIMGTRRRWTEFQNVIGRKNWDLFCTEATDLLIKEKNGFNTNK